MKTLKYIQTLENFQPTCAGCNETLNDKKNPSNDLCDECYNKTEMNPASEMGLTEKGSEEDTKAREHMAKVEKEERARVDKVIAMNIGQLLKLASKKQHFNIDDVTPEYLRAFILDNDLDK